MVTDVVLPQMGLEVTEGTVTAVLVAPGDAVDEGDTVIEVETDKAIAEVPAPRTGFVTAIEVEVGDTVPVGAILVRIGDDASEAVPAGAVAEAAPADSSAGPVAGKSPVPAPPAEESERPQLRTAGAGNGSGRLRAAPIARRAASRHGIALERVSGTGPAGRITLGDVERAVRELEAAPAAETPGGGRLESLSATRQAIARRMAESQAIPQYTLSRDVDAGWLLAEKRRLSDAGPAKVGVVDLLLQGLAQTLAGHPLLAASFVPGGDGRPPQLRHPEGIDLGLAVATDRGLLVPVVRRAGERTLAELALERARLIELTRGGRLGIEEMGGAAATLSSLGTFGVDRFTAMLNPGESSILAVGRTVERAVPRERGIAVVPTLCLTFSFDHRVVDGATGAAALSELAELLEGGMQWRT